MLKHDTPARRGLWDGDLLWEPSHQVALGQEVGNRFVVLPSWASDPKEELGHFLTVVSAAAAKTVGTQGLVRQNHLGLSPGTLELVTAKRATHLARFSRLHSMATHATFRLANKRVKVVVNRDA